jgi:hypothetical protein
MATAFFPVVMNNSSKDFDPYDETEAPLDLTDLAECPDQLGTVCAVHHCTRFLDEAPIITATSRDGDAVMAKRELFPHSWTAIVSHTSAADRANRRRTVTVRYCPACREAADRWFRDHLAA